MYSGQFQGAMYPYPSLLGGLPMPPFPMLPMIPAPMPPQVRQGTPIIPQNFINPEMGSSMQRIFLQSQKQQLLQLKDYVAKYADSIDEALAVIEEELSKSDKAQ